MPFIFESPTQIVCYGVKPTPSPTQSPSYSPIISQQPSTSHYPTYMVQKPVKDLPAPPKGQKATPQKVQKATAVNLVKVVLFLVAGQVKLRQSPALVCSTTAAPCLTQCHYTISETITYLR